jgi:hypothetical protein
MKVSEFKNYLEANPTAELRFVLPDGDLIPAHAHITEVGRIDKTFIDCGGTSRSLSLCSLQAWVAEDDETHRFAPGKLARVIDLAAPIFQGEDLDLEVEFEDCSISQFPVLTATITPGVLSFQLGSKHTDCLAKEACAVPLKGVNESRCC